MNSKITIGLAVFNGELFLKKRIENILEQTFQDFDIIVSDNNSDDNTNKICEEYQKNYEKIKYFKQKKNLGWLKNFKFILDNAKSEYFIWTSVNDIWENNFLEKNYEVLSNEPKFVGSTSKVDRYGGEKREIFSNRLIKKMLSKIKNFFSEFGTFVAIGSYENKIGVYLKKNCAQSLYSLYRTKYLKNSFVDEEISSVDLAIILKILKFGDLNVIDEILFHDFAGGLSSKGIIKTYNEFQKSTIDVFFPYRSFNKWVVNNLGYCLFFKNIHNIIKMNVGAFLAVCYDLIYKKKRN